MSARKASRMRSFNSVLHRVINLPLTIIQGMSRAMDHGMSIIGSGRRDQTLQQIVAGGSRAGMAATPMIPEEWAFLISFEQQYGDTHPFFLACGFMEALKAAERDSKLLFVYLHSPEHPYTAPFCSNTLCSELVVQFLDANCVSWGANADRGEGFQMSLALRVCVFPFCAIVVPASDNSIEVLQQVEGPVSPAELVEILQEAMEEQGSTFRTAAATAAADRQLRKEQDDAYLAAIRADQERETIREVFIEETVRKPEDSQKAGNNRKIVNDPAKNQANSKAKETTKETRHKDSVSHGKSPAVIQIRNNPTTTQSNKVKETIRETQHKASVAQGKNPTVTQIQIRFPNGERREQSFLCTDKIHKIFSYIDSLGLPGIGSYRLISSFPRRIYSFEQMGMTIKEAGLHPRANLFLELV